MARRFSLHPEVEARLWAAVLVGCAGAAAGEIYNALAPRGVFAPVVVSAPATPVAPAVPAKPRPVETVPKPASGRSAGQAAPTPPRDVDLAEVKALVEKKAAVFVDARSALRFASGHIPGAVSIPSSDFDSGFAKAKAALSGKRPVVVYCESADCDESDLVLEQLVKRGYVKLLHFKAGWQVWEDAGLPQAQGAPAPSGAR